jgi:hypothetical protein
MTVISWIWIALCFACAAVCVVDIAAVHRQKMAIMNVVWPITMLYAGPLGLWAYFAFGRKQPAGRRPPWQSIVTGATHCGAGCALGDFVAEWALFLTGFTIASSMLAASFAADFALAYAIGIVFQYFAIAPMRHLGIRDGMIAAIKADTLSLIAFEAGMFLWMWVARSFLFHPALKPNQPAYWFSMQIAMLIGFATSLPANRYLIGAGIKEAM